MVSLSFFFFLLLFVSYFFNLFSFLNSLLILESLSLLIFMFMYMVFFMFNSFSMLMIYFVFIVCESALGLSILVKIVKFYGCVNFSVLSLFSF